MAENMKRIWDNYKVIGEVKKSDSIKIVVAAAVRDGVKYINLREFYIRKRDNAWMPGRDGLTIPIMIPVKEGTEMLDTYAKIMPLLEATAKELETMPIEDATNAVYVTKKGASK